MTRPLDYRATNKLIDAGMEVASKHCCVAFTTGDCSSVQKKCRLVCYGNKKILAVDLENTTRSQLPSDSVDAIQFHDSDDAYLLKCRPLSFEFEGTNKNDVDARTIFGIREAAVIASLTSGAVDREKITAKVSWYEPEVIDDNMNQYSCCCVHPRGSWKRQYSNTTDENVTYQQNKSEPCDCNVSIIDLTKLQDMRRHEIAGLYATFSTSAEIFHLLRSTLNFTLDELHGASPWKANYLESEGIENDNADTGQYNHYHRIVSTKDHIVALLVNSPSTTSNSTSSMEEIEAEEYKKLLDFRVGDAAPSYSLYSTINLGTRNNFHKALYQNINNHRNERSNCLDSSAVSLFVYRQLPPRDTISNPCGDYKYKYPGCQVETYLDQPAQTNDGGIDSPSDLMLKRRIVSPPYLNLHDEFPRLLDPLVQRIEDVKREAELIPQWTAWPERNHYSSSDESAGASWTVFPLCYTFPANDVTQRKFIDKTCAFVPVTTSLLRDIGASLRTALFSRLDPNTKLGTHTGWSDLANHVVRVHIPLVVPKSEVCGTWVDGCVEMQDFGRIICFDDSKVHRAFNYSEKEERVVLILDLERPQNLPLGTARGGHTDELDRFIKELSS